MIVGLLERFPGYTLSTLRVEDAELLRLVAIVDLGTRKREVDGDGQ